MYPGKEVEPKSTDHITAAIKPASCSAFYDRLPTRVIGFLSQSASIMLGALTESKAQYQHSMLSKKTED